MSLQELESCITEERPFPKKPLVITFDDGDISLWERGFPLFKSMQIPIAIFVITSLVDTNKPYWWDEVVYHAPEKQIGYFKALSNKKRLSILNTICTESEKPTLQSVQLTSEQLKVLDANNILIANHSHTHPMFDQCSQEELEEEMLKSDAFMEFHGLSGRYYFAYPNGNWSAMAENVLHKMRFRLVFLFDHKVNSKKINPLRISRLSVDYNTSIPKLKIILSGFHSFLLKYK